MKTVMKKLLSIMLVALLLVSVMPTAFAATWYKLNVQLVVDGAVVATETLSNVAEGESATMSANMVKLNAEGFWPTYFAQNNFVSAEAVNIASMSKDETVSVYLESPECQHTETTATVKDATCGADGEKTTVCNNCNIVIATEVIPATGEHVYSNGYCACGAKDPTVPGDLVIYVMTRTYTEKDDSYTDYVDFNGGNAVVITGGADTSLTKALAQNVVGKQLMDYKWQGGDVDANGNKVVNLLATILETKDNKAVYQLRVQFNNGTSNYKQIDIYEGEGILAAIKNAGIAPTYAEHVLVGYTLNHTGTAETSINIYHVAEASMANEQGIIKIYADWREVSDDDDEDYEYGEGGGLNGDANVDPIYDAVLMIYTNNNVKSHALKVTANELGAYTKDGKLTRSEVELVVRKNFTVSSNTKYYGLFTTKTWDKGDYDVDYAVSSVELDPKDTTTVYIMVTNAKLIEADPSNPKTGDGIVVALAAMMSTGGAALVLGKKKFF